MGVGSAGRNCVLARIGDRFEQHGARFEGSVLKGTPIAAFSCLRPRSPLLSTDEQPRSQVMIEYLLVGRYPPICRCALLPPTFMSSLRGQAMRVMSHL